MTQLQTKTLGAIKARINNFDLLNPGEKVLQVMAYLSDVLHVHEDKGYNSGIYIDDFLEEAGGLNPGNPYCAATINWICEMLEIPNPDKADASVLGWYNWAKANNKLQTKPKRGYLCLYLHADKTGHVGIVVSSDINRVLSIEANTSSGDKGSQRDGEGIFRRQRSISVWQFYINLD